MTLGLVSAGRVRASEAPGYIVAQVLGAAAGAGLLWLIASGGPGFSLEGGFAANGYGAHSPGGYGLVSALVCELVMTFFFLLVILGATSERAPPGLAPLAIGLCLTLIDRPGPPASCPPGRRDNRLAASLDVRLRRGPGAHADPHGRAPLPRRAAAPAFARRLQGGNDPSGFIIVAERNDNLVQHHVVENLDAGGRQFPRKPSRLMAIAVYQFLDRSSGP